MVGTLVTPSAVRLVRVVMMARHRRHRVRLLRMRQRRGQTRRPRRGLQHLQGRMVLRRRFRRRLELVQVGSLDRCRGTKPKPKVITLTATWRERLRMMMLVTMVPCGDRGTSGLLRLGSVVRNKLFAVKHLKQLSPPPIVSREAAALERLLQTETKTTLLRNVR